MIKGSVWDINPVYIDQEYVVIKLLQVRESKKEEEEVKLNKTRPGEARCSGQEGHVKWVWN